MPPTHPATTTQSPERTDSGPRGALGHAFPAVWLAVVLTAWIAINVAKNDPASADRSLDGLWPAADRDPRARRGCARAAQPHGRYAGGGGTMRVSAPEARDTLADQVAERIIASQERVVGAAAWKLARRVKQLDVGKDRCASSRITGELGARMCFMAAADLLRDHPELDIASFRPFRRLG